MADVAQTPTPVPAPTSHSTPAKRAGWLKAGFLGTVGLVGGTLATYFTAVVDTVVKPAKPVANFATAADGLNLTCQNHATGESGWWDFGDGSPLEPFEQEKPAAHAYTKAGVYSVKLTVRNFLGDENERSVPVEVKAGPKDAPPPQIAAFVVQPVSPASVAPATFRFTADVSNAGSCVWDYGDGRLEVTDGGKIDRLVTFEKPGTFAVSLVAHNGKQGAKQSAPVKVEAPREGSTMAVLKVIDTGTKVDRLQTTESVAVHVPDKAAANFSRTVHARAGFTLASATVADTPASVKNVKVQVSADKRSAVVSGDWAGDLKATNKAAGGSDAIIRVKMTQERMLTQPPTMTMVTGMFTVSGQSLRADLPLPPAPVGINGAKREFQLEVRAMRDSKSQTILQAPTNGTGSISIPWSTTQQGPGWSVVYNAKQEGDNVVVTAVQTTK